MVLLKNLAVTMVRRKNLLNIRKANMLEGLSLTQFHQIRNLVFNAGKFPPFRGVYKGFCTNIHEVPNEYSAEDLSVEEELMKRDEEETETKKVFEEIAAGDPQILKRLKLLELEVAVLREEECRAPDVIKKSSWIDLLGMGSLTKRKKYLAFLRLNELKSLGDKRKSKVKHEINVKRKEELGFHYYGLSGHSMFMRVYDKPLNRLLNIRSLKSNLEIILDCSYQEYMSDLNLRACAKQIFYCVTESRVHRFPCQLKLYNFDKNDALGKILPSYVCAVYEQNIVDIHTESYLKAFPKDKLVYLTPHSPVPLKEFDPSLKYIIGAYVDKGTGVKASLAKAKENDIRMCRFPIDEYLIWKKGTKSLPLNVVLSTLLDMAYYNDWNKAFKNLPSRCLQD